MSQAPPSIAKLYELMASGQFEIPHSPESELAIRTWLAEQLGPGELGAWARTEALRLQPELNPWPPRSFDGEYVLVLKLRLWAEASDHETLWIRALLACWRCEIWRARVVQAIDRHVARGERVA